MIDYIKFSEQNPSLKHISNTLFTHLDKKKAGMISFKDMLKVMIRGITKD